MPDTLRAPGQYKADIVPSDPPEDVTIEHQQRIRAVAERMKREATHIQNEPTRIDLVYRLDTVSAHPENAQALLAVEEMLENPDVLVHYLQQPEEYLSWGSFFSRADDLFGPDAEQLLSKGNRDHLIHCLYDRIRSNPRMSRALVGDWKHSEIQTRPGTTRKDMVEPFVDPTSIDEQTLGAVIDQMMETFREYQGASVDAQHSFQYKRDMKILNDLRKMLIE